MPPNISPYDQSVWVLPLVFAITSYEAAHGFVAYRLGDNTAHKFARVSFNPLKRSERASVVRCPGKRQGHHILRSCAKLGEHPCWKERLRSTVPAPVRNCAPGGRSSLISLRANPSGPP